MVMNSNISLEHSHQRLETQIATGRIEILAGADGGDVIIPAPFVLGSLDPCRSVAFWILATGHF